ncbi:NUDIX hydrolase [Sedimentitalea sp. HM32M-2]|uniref:NUDIX hydrolase n=1 Tax=Sedimentitalea sp. HM32M-2 TaxID=3351566 RepID=UPI003644B21D
MLIKQLPITIKASHKSDVRSQFAALCYRVQRDRPQILLVTSRRTGRWIVPKGWPMDGMTPAQSAAQEAWEEAGVVGKPIDRCLGLYSYYKVLNAVGGLPCVAMIYPVRVKSLVRDFPERYQRRRKWFSPKKAAARVTEPELARILRDFDPKILG